MWQLAFQIRRLIIATAIAFLLALGQGLPSVASDGCGEPVDAASLQEFDFVERPALQACGDHDCAGTGCCGTHTVAGCCHSGGAVLADRLAPMYRLQRRTSWMPLQDNAVVGIWPDVGRHPPRL